MNSPYTYIANILEETPDIPPGTIISRTVYRDDQIKVILFGFAAEQELSEHTASQTAQLYFVQGEAELTLGDDSVSAQAGTWVHMPPKLPHSVTAKTPVFMLLTMFNVNTSV